MIIWEFFLWHSTVYITTGKRIFAECPALCRVPKVGHSAKGLFAECEPTDTQQRTNTQQRTLCRVLDTRQSEYTRQKCLCRVSGARQRMTLGKDGTPSTWVAAVKLCRVS